MSHPDEGILQELLDGELPPSDAAAVRAHLAGCVPCAVLLRDLAATQTESDAIVARLPLDPPLVKPAGRARPRRALNLRAIGLAASVLLVAGTSWMLLRPAGSYSFRGSNDTSSGLALPMPSEERQEVPATTPAVPPSPSAGARADRSADRAEKAKQAPLEKKETEANVPAAKVTDGPADKDLAGEGRRASDIRPASLPEVSAPAAPAPAAALSAGAAMAPGATMTTVAEAEARLGTRLRTISGLTPVSVEMLPVAADSLLAVRQRYVVSGVPVTLIQASVIPAARDEVTTRERDAARYVDGVAAQPGNRGNGFVASGESGGVQPASRSWGAWGSLFQLRGALPADSIDALMKRVK